jgi:acyl-coenzyme A synthetase/AMP-(fatty) acid ligase
MTVTPSTRNNAAWQCLFRTAADRPDDVAIELWDGVDPVARWTFDEAATRTLGIAARLNEAGVNAGDRVLIRLRNHPDFAFAFFAACTIGAVAVPCAPGLTPHEMAILALDSGARVLLRDPDLSGPAGDTNALKEVLFRVGKPMERSVHRVECAAVMSEQPAWMVYTSGTTSRPKGVVHGHRALAGREPMRDAWTDIRRHDRVLHAGTLNWTYSMGVGVMDPWTVGATSIVLTAHPEPSEWPRVWEACGATIFATVPSLYRRILKYARLDRDTAPALRHALSAGETLRDDARDQWIEMTGRSIYESLGMSECSTYVSYGPTIAKRSGSLGKVQPGRAVAVVAEAHPHLDAGEGEIGVLAIHRSEPGLMLGYHERPDEETAAFHDDWFLTGDLVRRDEDGYLFYEGRRGDLLNVSGFRVSPLEVESAVLSVPEIVEVAVGITASNAGVELLTAWFVGDGKAEALSAKTLGERVGLLLAPYKVPRRWIPVGTLPRTRTGKLVRSSLTDLWREGEGHSATATK